MWELTEGSLASAYVRKMTLFALTGDVWVAHIPLHGRRRIFVPKGRAITEEIAAALTREHVSVADRP